MTALLRVVELFSGIGAQASALERAGIPHECVAVCEIDRYAYTSYCAIHGDVPNLGDIRKVERLPECDLLTYSFPCQDISIAGKRKGFGRDTGTRSGLLWEVERLLRCSPLPKVLVLENVDSIVNTKNVRQFNEWVSILADMGYTSSWKILNAKDFDIPQNRARCFMVSCLDGTYFQFPEGKSRTRCLKDILESEVDEKYYLSSDRLARLVAHKERYRAQGHGFGFSVTDMEGDSKTVKSRAREEEDTLIQVAQILGPGVTETTGRVYDPSGASPAIQTLQGGNRQPKVMVTHTRQSFDADRVVSADGLSDPIVVKHLATVSIRNNTAKGYAEAEDGDGVILDQPDSKTKCGRVQEGRSPTVMTSRQVGTVDKMRIRRLTPRECWRVMDFSDADYDKASSAVVEKRQMSECQLYKQAGNSICVGVLVAIFEKLYNTKQTVKQPMLCEFGNIKETNTEVKQ